MFDGFDQIQIKYRIKYNYTNKFFIELPESKCWKSEFYLLTRFEFKSLKSLLGTTIGNADLRGLIGQYLS